MTLYELTGEYRRILDGVDDPEMGLFAEDALLLTKEDYEKKAENYAKLIKTLEGEAEALKTESDRLTARRKVRQNAVERLKHGLQESMDCLGLLKIKTPLFSLSIQNNPPSVNIQDISALPEGFLVYMDPVPDKDAIKTAIKRGEAVPGAELVAGRSLRIR